MRHTPQWRRLRTLLVALTISAVLAIASHRSFTSAPNENFTLPRPAVDAAHNHLADPPPLIEGIQGDYLPHGHVAAPVYDDLPGVDQEPGHN
jgi:hypothetical protein